METLDLLQRRRSSKRFGKFAPNKEQTTAILQAGLRAPDHGHLKPYRFIVINQEAMPTFAQHLQAAALEFEMGEKGIEKASKLSQRAPMVIGVVAKVQKDIPKVPEWEQVVTAGCATYAMQLATNTLGFDTCWITNKWVKGAALRQAFQCEEDDQIVALLLIGSPEEDKIALADEAEDLKNFVQYFK